MPSGRSRDAPRSAAIRIRKSPHRMDGQQAQRTGVRAHQECEPKCSWQGWSFPKGLERARIWPLFCKRPVDRAGRRVAGKSPRGTFRKIAYNKLDNVSGLHAVKAERWSRARRCEPLLQLRQPLTGAEPFDNSEDEADTEGLIAHRGTAARLQQINALPSVPRHRWRRGEAGGRQPGGSE